MLIMFTDFVPNPDNNPECLIPGNTSQFFFGKKEPVEHRLKGSRKAVMNTIYSLYNQGYAQLYEWTPLEPSGMPGEVISTLTRYLILD
ncbi:MAG: hypothetical protein F6K26_08080 [Moorea sp. SIO2I5]|nr:hypothetical protein [Moorena sp. SIO2I5]